MQECPPRLRSAAAVPVLSMGKVPVLHDEGGRRTTLRARTGRSNPISAQYRREAAVGSAPTGKAKPRPDAVRGARWQTARAAQRAGKCPNAPKLTNRSKAPAKGRLRVPARTHRASGGAPRAPAGACPRMHAELSALSERISMHAAAYSLVSFRPHRPSSRSLSHRSDRKSFFCSEK